MTRSPAAAATASPVLAVLALLGVTAVWGSTFFLLKDVVDRVPVTDLLGVRFALGALVLAAVVPRAVARLTPDERRTGAALGLVYGAGQLVQTLGLQTTSASVSGFITGMYVVITPVLAALLLRARLGRTAWTAVALSTAGLAVLSLQGLSVGVGEALTLLSALLYAVHILGLGRWSRPANALGLAVVQLSVTAVICLVGALPGGIALPHRAYDWGALLYLAVVAGALTLVGQTWAQSQIAPTRAAVIMTMEPVWAAGFAVALGGEVLGWRALLGGALVLAAMYLVEMRGSAPPAPVRREAVHAGRP